MSYVVPFPSSPNSISWENVTARLLQKNTALTATISHFFCSCFDFCGSIALQRVARQRQARIQPLPKKSSLKSYRRFFAFSDQCQNRPVKVQEQTRRLDRMNGIDRIKTSSP